MNFRRMQFYGITIIFLLALVLLDFKTMEAEASPSAAGISGIVTAGGEPVEGAYLELHEIPFGKKLSTLTIPDGTYLFTDIQSSTGPYYQVLFFNGMETPYNSSYLEFWWSDEIVGYTTGSQYSVNSFDIDNLEPINPADDAVIKLPYTFTWQPYAHDLIYYSFWLFNESHEVIFSRNITTPTITMTDLPEGVEFGDQYRWTVGIFTLRSGYGFISEHPVVFSDQYMVFLPVVVSE